MGSKPIGISASRAAAVLGINSYQSQYEIWQRLKEEYSPGFNADAGYAMPPSPDNAAIRWGSAFEDTVIVLAENTIDGFCGIISREMLYTAEIICQNQAKTGTFPMELTCHIDGEYANRDGMLHEGKTTSSRAYAAKWGKPGTNRIPIEYQVQVQHQMICTGATEAIVSVLVFPKSPELWEEMGWLIEKWPGGDYTIEDYKNPLNHRSPIDWAKTLADMGFFHQYHISADPELHTVMIDKYTEFYSRYIIGSEEPQPGNSDDIKRCFIDPVGSIVATKEISDMIIERNEITKEIGTSSHLSKRKDTLKVKILSWLRLQDTKIDDASREKTIIYSSDGHKIASYNGKIFR
jgi:hypothetical protein